MNELQREIEELIAREGPIGIDRYMTLCLTHPEYGYYVTADPLGVRGDFTTAPEISQMFGEMIGIWTLLSWEAMGRPSAFDLIELGPGRGTLMRDLLRVAGRDTGFRTSVRARLVEVSPVLEAVQRESLAGSGIPVSWHKFIGDIPVAPSITIANEFFDALPIRQFQRVGPCWRELMIGNGHDGLCLMQSDAAAEILSHGEEGQIVEVCEAGLGMVRQLAQRIIEASGALLAIDYGYAHGERGDTLQAIRRHAFCGFLEHPGCADLTAHVDFAALVQAAELAGAHTYPVLTQRTLMQRLGIEARAASLMTTNPGRRDDIAAALSRLIGLQQGGMGGLFKAMAVSHPSLAVPAFDASDPIIESLAHDRT